VEIAEAVDCLVDAAVQQALATIKGA
jgi:hypothetical protein